MPGHAAWGIVEHSKSEIWKKQTSHPQLTALILLLINKPAEKRTNFIGKKVWCKNWENKHLEFVKNKKGGRTKKIFIEGGFWIFYFALPKVGCRPIFLAVRVLQLVGQPIEAFVEAVARRGTGCLKSNEEAQVEPNQWQSRSKGQLDTIWKFLNKVNFWI